VSTLYLAPKDFLSELERELVFLGVKIKAKKGNFIWADGDALSTAWCQDIWQNIEEIPIVSIGDGIKKLREKEKNWCLVSVENHRRANLILEKLATPRERKISFPSLIEKNSFGSFTLWEKDLVLASRKNSYPLPRGEIFFEENQKDPPSRAYLKLWEALTLLGEWPKKGERCLDLGSSPGSWTWALAKLGASVLSIDRSELAPNVANMEGVEFRKGNAFSIRPHDIEKIDWLFSDVICFPEKLLELVEAWLESGLCKRFVCTIKFQGKVDPAITEKFKKISGAKVLHLFHNKHELTWICVRD